MISYLFLSPPCSFLLIPLVIALLFGRSENDCHIQNISWSVPFPPDLLARLREFSPLSISRTSGICLDDVFDILNGNKDRTAPEVIDKLTETVRTLKKRDEELDREAARMAYMLRGFEALENRERPTSPEKTGTVQKKKLSG